MSGVFWLGLAYGFCIGLAFWCRDVLNKEWQRANQPPIQPVGYSWY